MQRAGIGGGGDKKVPKLLLAHKWSLDKVTRRLAQLKDPKGWWMSEKLDGVRAYWDGKRFWSRLVQLSLIVGK